LTLCNGKQHAALKPLRQQGTEVAEEEAAEEEAVAVEVTGHDEETHATHAILVYKQHPVAAVIPTR
jgi:hypothetical protein